MLLWDDEEHVRKLETKKVGWKLSKILHTVALRGVYTITLVNVFHSLHNTPFNQVTL